MGPKLVDASLQVWPLLPPSHPLACPAAGMCNASSRALSTRTDCHLSVGELQHMEWAGRHVRGDLCVQVYGEALATLLPTPTRSHYTFNLRDLCKVFQGMQTAGGTLRGRDDAARLWTHEVLRVFADRLVDDGDREWFAGALQRALEAHLKLKWCALCRTSTHPFHAHASACFVCGSVCATKNNNMQQARTGGTAAGARSSRASQRLAAPSALRSYARSSLATSSRPPPKRAATWSSRTPAPSPPRSRSILPSTTPTPKRP